MDGSRESALRMMLGAVLEDRTDDARTLLGKVLDSGAESAGSRDALREIIFASALSRRLDPAASAEINLYLQQFEQPQISLYNLVARQVPTVSLSIAVSNDLLGRFIGGRPEVTLLDVGIGSGRQEAALLRALAASDRLPRRLTVVAVEPDPVSLREAESNLAVVAAETAMELDFRAINLVTEELEDQHWDLVRSAPGPLVMHGAFALHHIRDRNDGYCARSEFLRRLRRLNPLAVVLCEPNSDHHTPLLGERFENCWRHFGLTFDLIDRAGLPPRETAAVKMFFAREIHDVLGNAEETRCERHESVSAWMERLRRAGFTPYSDFGLEERLDRGGVEVRPRDGYVGLDYRGETLVAVICATSGALAAPTPRPARELAHLA